MGNSAGETVAVDNLFAIMVVATVVDVLRSRDALTQSVGVLVAGFPQSSWPISQTVICSSGCIH